MGSHFIMMLHNYVYGTHSLINIKHNIKNNVTPSTQTEAISH